MCTTSGTGSEISKWCVIGDAATGMDVLAHCVEAITNKNYNPYGYIFGKEGIKLAMKWLPIAVKDPSNKESREKMSLAANLGGMAITASGCSIGHSFAQTFGAVNHIDLANEMAHLLIHPVHRGFRKYRNLSNIPTIYISRIGKR